MDISTTSLYFHAPLSKSILRIAPSSLLDQNLLHSHETIQKQVESVVGMVGERIEVGECFVGSECDYYIHGKQPMDSGVHQISKEKVTMEIGSIASLVLASQNGKELAQHVVAFTPDSIASLMAMPRLDGQGPVSSYGDLSSFVRLGEDCTFVTHAGEQEQQFIQRRMASAAMAWPLFTQ